MKKKKVEIGVSRSSFYTRILVSIDAASARPSFLMRVAELETNYRQQLLAKVSDDFWYYSRRALLGGTSILLSGRSR